MEDVIKTPRAHCQKQKPSIAFKLLHITVPDVGVMVSMKVSYR